MDESSTYPAPTISGAADIGPELAYTETVELTPGNATDAGYARYKAPNGTGVDFFPLPMIQPTVGVPFGTDISVRFVPRVGYRN